MTRTATMALCAALATLAGYAMRPTDDQWELVIAGKPVATGCTLMDKE